MPGSCWFTPCLRFCHLLPQSTQDGEQHTLQLCQGLVGLRPACGSAICYPNHHRMVSSTHSPVGLRPACVPKLHETELSHSGDAFGQIWVMAPCSPCCSWTNMFFKQTVLPLLEGLSEVPYNNTSELECFTWTCSICSTPHGKDKIPKFRNKYCQKRNIGVSVPISTFMRLWALLYIPTMGLPFLLEEICRPILGLYKSLTDTWMLKLGLRPRYSQKRNT